MTETRRNGGPGAQRILLSHGAGGKLTHKLIQDLFVPRYGNEILAALLDGAVLPPQEGDPVLTTDSYVVRPAFFPGGDIGSLAVHGTVNDLLMCGAKPLALTVGFILEEGLSGETLQRICTSIGRAAREAAVQVVAGDTKVVERGHGDGIYINTTGLGFKPHGVALGPERVSTGDAILINGPVGQHGIAVLGARGDLPIATPVCSDSKALNAEVEALLSLGAAVHLLRDPTRGGLATCLNEIAQTSGKGIVLEEGSIPRDAGVEEACELLGFDSLYVANEGKVVAVVEGARAGEALEALRSAGASEAAIIGTVTGEEPLVVGRGAAGGERLLDMLSGDPLPRIC